MVDIGVRQNPFTQAASTPFGNTPSEFLSSFATRATGKQQMQEFEALQQALIQQAMQEEARQFNQSEGNKFKKTILDAVGPRNAAQILPNIQGVSQAVADPALLDPIAALNRSLGATEVAQNQASALQAATAAQENAADIGNTLTLDESLQQLAGGRVATDTRDPLKVRVAEATAQAKQQTQPVGQTKTKRTVITGDPKAPVEVVEETKDVFADREDEVAPTTQLIDGLPVPTGIQGKEGTSKAKTLPDGKVVKFMDGTKDGKPVVLIYDDRGNLLQVRDKETRKLIEVE